MMVIQEVIDYLTMAEQKGHLVHNTARTRRTAFTQVFGKSPDDEVIENMLEDKLSEIALLKKVETINTYRSRITATMKEMKLYSLIGDDVFVNNNKVNLQKATLELVVDPIDDCLEEMSLLASAWYRNRQKKKPSPILRQSLIMCAEKLVELVDNKEAA